MVGRTPAPLKKAVVIATIFLVGLLLGSPPGFTQGQSGGEQDEASAGRLAASPTRQALWSLPQAGAQGRNITYTYDEAGRLIGVDYGGGISISYAYDKAGNQLVRQAVGMASAPTATVTATASATPSPTSTATSTRTSMPTPTATSTSTVTPALAYKVFLPVTVRGYTGAW